MEICSPLCISKKEMKHNELKYFWKRERWKYFYTAILFLTHATLSAVFSACILITVALLPPASDWVPEIMLMKEENVSNRKRRPLKTLISPSLLRFHLCQLCSFSSSWLTLRFELIISQLTEACFKCLYFLCRSLLLFF